jgi:putative membrane protein
MSRSPGFLTLAVSLAGLAAESAFADSTKTIPAAANPTFANPDTPGLLAGKPTEAANIVDVIVLKQLAIGGRAEVDLGKLAEQRSGAAPIDEFGKRMVKDHGDSNSKVASVARAANVDLPEQLDAEHVAAKTELQSLQGGKFDLRYVDTQIKDHQKAVQLLIHEIASGQHTRVRQLAADTLPAVMEHLQHAKDLHVQLTGAGPPPPP